MITEIFHKVVVFFDVWKNISISQIIHYASSLPLREGISIVFAYYFLFLYSPIRFLLNIFFGKWYKKYALKDERIYTHYRAFPTYIGGLRLMKFLRVGKKAYQELAPMPLWMDCIAFIVIFSELGFLVIGILHFYF